MTTKQSCPAQDVLDFAIKDLEREIKDQQWMIDNYKGHHKEIHENISKALRYALNLLRQPPMTPTPARQPHQEYLAITSEELLIIEHGCIYPDKDECIGKHCKYHDPNPSFRDNIVCLLNEHDVADQIRSRPHPATRPPCEECIYQAKAAKAQQRIEQVIKELEKLRDSTYNDLMGENAKGAYEQAIALLQAGEL